jgi:hypothetical protein
MEPTKQGEAGMEVAKLSQVIQIDERKIQAHLRGVVRSTVKQTLNALLDAEADRLCRAERYATVCSHSARDMAAMRFIELRHDQTILSRTVCPV